MGRGGARVGAGRRPKPVAMHLLAGTFRVDRHGPRPSNAAPMPEPSAAWSPTPAELKALGAPGRDFLARMLGAYDVSLTDGAQLLEAARAADVLADLRTVNPPDLRQIRLWSAYFTGLVRALGLSK